MADGEFIPYKDISELKKDLEGVRDKKDVSTKELYEAVRKLAEVIGELLDVFGAASEQLKIEEKESESESKKHELIASKLDKLIEQNKTIAEGMVAIVEMVNEKMPKSNVDLPAAEEDDHTFKPKQEPAPNPQPEWKPIPQPEWKPIPQPEWKPIPQQIAPNPQPLPQPMMSPQNFNQPNGPQPNIPNFNQPGFGQLPPMEPSPMPDLDFDEPLAIDEPKKKGLFGMFKK